MAQKFSELTFGFPNVSEKYCNMTEQEYQALPDCEKNKYEYDDHSRTYKLDDLCWKAQRQHWVGYENPTGTDYVEYTVTGSESGYVAAADSITRQMLGEKKEKLHFFKCKSELWLNKRGIDLPLKSAVSKAQQELFDTGHMFEAVARVALEKELSKKYPGAVWEVKMGDRMYQCGKKNEDGTLVAPWLIATPDGFVYRNGVLYALAEFKNIQYFSPNMAYVKKKHVPPEYYTQVHHYFMGTGLSKCFVMCITGNSYPNDFKMFEVDKDEAFCDELFRVEEEFVDSLHKGIAPAMDGSDGQDISKLYELLRKASGNYRPDLPPVYGDASLIDIVEDLTFIDEDICSLKERIKELEEQKKELLVKHVFPVVAESNELRVPFDESSFYSVCLKDSKETIFICPEEIKEKEPEAYKDSLERKFSVTIFKEKFPFLYKKYAKVQDNLTEKKENYCNIKVILKKKEAV